MDWSNVFNMGLLQNTLRTATPVILVGLGCLMTDHVGIMNIGVDGMMLVGAFMAVLGSYFFSSWAMGLLFAVLAGVLLGLLLVPCALLFSRARGYAAYCRGICPLGLLAQWLGRAAPWRVRRVGDCCDCMACVRACRQDAMNEAALEKGIAANTCHLCRDCIHVCPKGALALTWLGKTGSRNWAGTVFLALLAGLHAAFLFMARI